MADLSSNVAHPRSADFREGESPEGHYFSLFAVTLWYVKLERGQEFSGAVIETP